MNTDKLTTIRNLLAKAEDAACPAPEAEALTDLAVRLMAKYGIEQAMLDADRPTRRDAVGNRRVVCDAPYALEKAALLGGLVVALGGQAVRLADRPGRSGRLIHAFGFEGDLDRAELLYTSLLLQSGQTMRAAEANGARPDWDDVRAWRRSFLSGFTDAVIRRIQAAEREAQALAEHERASTGPSVALAVANRSAEVDRAYRETYPRVQQARRTLSGTGGGAGRRAGAAADIGGRRVGGASGRALASGQN